MDKIVNFRQILLVTDGESNVGCDPISVARDAYKAGITVNTIGIVNGVAGEKPMVEIQEIANVGGGVWELTDIGSFYKTMEMVTQKSVYKTIEEAVSRELRSILGTGLNDIHPDSRKKIISLIDKLGDEINVKCCIVIDCSGSMANKIDIAKKSILNLLRILKSRKGKTEIGVITYSGKGQSLYRVVCDFTEDIVELERELTKITVGGTTPTGPALKAAIDLFLGGSKEDELLGSNIV